MEQGEAGSGLARADVADEEDGHSRPTSRPVSAQGQVSGLWMREGRGRGREGVNQKPAPAAEVRREADGDEVFEYAVGDERIGSDDAGRRAAGEVEVQLAEAREVSGDLRAVDVVGEQFTLLKFGRGRRGGGGGGAQGGG